MPKSAPDIEERAVLDYLKVYPAPFPDYLFDGDGNINDSVKQTYNYLGLVDGLLGRPSKEALIDDTSDMIGYHCAYDKGVMFRMRTNPRSIS